jgi:hypothetical protein
MQERRGSDAPLLGENVMSIVSTRVSCSWMRAPKDDPDVVIRMDFSERSSVRLVSRPGEKVGARIQHGHTQVRRHSPSGRLDVRRDWYSMVEGIQANTCGYGP